MKNKRCACNGLNNLKNVNKLISAQKTDEALRVLEKLLLKHPKSSKVKYLIAKCYTKLENFEKALLILNKLYTQQISPLQAVIHTLRWEISLKTALFDIRAQELQYMKKCLNHGMEIHPFWALCEDFTNKDLFVNMARFHKRKKAFISHDKHYNFTDKNWQHDKINIAFISPDFKVHPISYVISGLFENLDSNIFNVYLYDTDPNPYSSTERKKRIQTANVNYKRLWDILPSKMADIVFHDHIDILVDLSGLTKRTQLFVLTYRPAPIQVTFLGFPGTVGKIPGLDYVFCDKLILPPTEQKYYYEKFAYLPRYFPYDATNKIDLKPINKKDYGISEKSIVLACFCNNFKVTQAYLDVWLRVMKKVPDTVLWLYAKTRLFQDNILKYAASKGISRNRLIFSPYCTPYSKYLAQYKCVDLFLDTQYYNGHTTVADALFAGCPVVTCPGKTFASRVGGSILSYLGMDELICKNITAYEKKILELAENPQKLHKVRMRLQKQKNVSDFFNNKKYAENFEKTCCKLVKARKG